MNFLISSYRALFARWAGSAVEDYLSLVRAREFYLQYRIFSPAFVAFIVLVKQTDIHAVELRHNEPLTKVCETRLAQ